MRAALPRSGDLLARYGGEEFVVILPATGRNGAEIVAARMHRAMTELKIEHKSPTGLFATVSIGVAAAGILCNHSSHELTKAADVALYRAKLSGSNRLKYQPSRRNTGMDYALRDSAYVARDSAALVRPIIPWSPEICP